MSNSQSLLLNLLFVCALCPHLTTFTSLSKLHVSSPSTNLIPRTRGSVSMTTVIGISALRATAIVNQVRRCSLLPITHALSLVPITPIATLTPVALLSQNLLLCPNYMALPVIPRTSSRVISCNAARFRLCHCEIHPKAETFNSGSNTSTNTNTFRSFLAD